MKIPVARIFATLLILAAPAPVFAVDPLQAIVDRTQVRELMHRHGVSLYPPDRVSSAAGEEGRSFTGEAR